MLAIPMPYRWIHQAEAGSQQWLLRRNCALSPAQLALGFSAIGLVTILIAVVFAAQGAWLVVPFAGLELLALAIAFVVHARHAGDYERIVLQGGSVLVERVHGGALARLECPAPWLRVQYGGSRRELIRLVAAGKEVAVGRYVPDGERTRLARELRASVARWADANAQRHGTTHG
jgi:uncharacterized membrane protein